jgi:hypothetical protein
MRVGCDLVSDYGLSARPSQRRSEDRLLEHDLHPARPRRPPHDLAGDELAGLTPTLFEHVNPLGTYTFDTDRPAGQLRPLRAASAA